MSQLRFDKICSNQKVGVRVIDFLIIMIPVTTKTKMGKARVSEAIVDTKQPSKTNCKSCVQVSLHKRNTRHFYTTILIHMACQHHTIQDSPPRLSRSFYFPNSFFHNHRASYSILSLLTIAIALEESTQFYPIHNHYRYHDITDMCNIFCSTRNRFQMNPFKI